MPGRKRIKSGLVNTPQGKRPRSPHPVRPTRPGLNQRIGACATPESFTAAAEVETATAGGLESATPALARCPGQRGQGPTGHRGAYRRSIAPPATAATGWMECPATEAAAAGGAPEGRAAVGTAGGLECPNTRTAALPGCHWAWGQGSTGHQGRTISGWGPQEALRRPIAAAALGRGERPLPQPTSGPRARIGGACPPPRTPGVRACHGVQLVGPWEGQVGCMKP